MYLLNIKKIMKSTINRSAMVCNLVAVRRKITLKAITFLFICISSFIFFGSHLLNIKNLSSQTSTLDRKDLMIKMHAANVENFYTLRVVSSKLGGILFNREEIPNPNPNANRTFVVLVWKYWDWLKSRHVYNFGKPRNNIVDILEGCSVKNCIFSDDDYLMNTADAVLVHLQRGLVPEVKNRNPKQRWIFLNDESPRHAFTLAEEKPSLERFYDIFNWSMTYRSDADIPVPYGRTLALKSPIVSELTLTEIAALVPNWEKKRRDRPAALLMSNCGVKSRNAFLQKLRKHVDVDVFGKCSEKKEYRMSCPGHFRADCDPVAQYLFYLVLENTSCFQYLTEKVFYNAYSKGAIPVIFGPSLEDVQALLPPNSYIFVDSETNIETLAKEINTLAENSELLLAMHMWRNNFRIVNEHGYFGTKSYHLCRLCEALNYNDNKEKVYNKERLDLFLDPSQSCYDKK